MNKFIHSAIVPLIGGLPIGTTKAFGSDPEFVLSYGPFGSNDSHMINHYSGIPVYLLDQVETKAYADVVSSTCPCAGLSSLSTTANPDAAANDWMYKTTEYVLSTTKPKVLFGENAPALCGKWGEPVVKRLFEIGQQNGYSMSLYRTKSLLHGIPQVRERSFFFFWQGDEVPVLEYFNKERPTIEELILSVPKDASLHTVTNSKTPSKDDPWYRYVLEHLEGGITHRQFYDKLEKTDNPMDWLEKKGVQYSEVAKWFDKNGYEKLAVRARTIDTKLKAGGSIMRRASTIPKNYIGAFVGHLPTMLTHPYEDRYITYREAMTIMGLPLDFQLLNPKKNLNHVCQNVPVGTAADMASEVKAFLEGKRRKIKLYNQVLIQYNNTKTEVYRDMEEETVATIEEFFV